MKRQIALFIAAAILAVSMTACGDSEATDAPAGTEAAEATTTSAPETEASTAESVVTTEAPVPETEATEATTTETVTEAPATKATTAATTVATTVMTTAATTKATTPATTKASVAKSSDYEKYGFKCINFKSGDVLKGYRNVVISTGDNYEKAVQGKLSWLQTSTDSKNAKEGYELKTLSITLSFDSNDLIDGHWNFGTRTDDYYDVKLYDDSYTTIDDANADRHFRFTVNHNGVEYKDCEGVLNFGWSKGDPCMVDGKSCDVEMYLFATFMVPKGYDGTVIALYDYSQNDTDFYEMNHKDTVFIRLL